MYAVEIIAKTPPDGNGRNGWSRKLVGPFETFTAAYDWTHTHTDGDLVIRPLEHVDDGGHRLREMLALQTARRILTDIANQDKIGDDYHDAVIDVATAYVGLYK